MVEKEGEVEEVVGELIRPKPEEKRFEVKTDIFQQYFLPPSPPDPLP